MSTNLHHTSITCRELHKSLRFYSLFGFEEEKVFHDDDVSITMLSRGDGVRIELFHYPNKAYACPKSSPLPSIERPGITHIAFQVDDIHAFHRQFLKLGICTDIKPARLGGFVYFFTTDPDGNQIEILMET